MCKTRWVTKLSNLVAYNQDNQGEKQKMTRNEKKQIMAKIEKIDYQTVKTCQKIISIAPCLTKHIPVKIIRKIVSTVY